MYIFGKIPGILWCRISIYGHFCRHYNSWSTCM